ncbi:MAG: DUF2079 domain-containing protein [Caldilineaceae bacterium]
MIGLLGPFGFLALLAPEILLLSLPLLLANLLSAYPAQYYGEFHYSAPVVAYVAAAAAYGAGRLWRALARARRTSGSFQHLPAAGAGTMAAASVVTNARTALRPLLTWLLVAWIVAWAARSYLVHERAAGRTLRPHTRHRAPSAAALRGPTAARRRGHRDRGRAPPREPPALCLSIPNRVGCRRSRTGQRHVGLAGRDDQHGHGPGD